MTMKTALLAAAFVAVSLPASASTLADQATCAKLADAAAEKMSRHDNWYQEPWAESHDNDKLHICIAKITTTARSGHYENHQFVPQYPETFISLQDAASGYELGSFMWKNDKHQKFWDVPPYACHVEPMPYANP